MKFTWKNLRLSKSNTINYNFRRSQREDEVETFAKTDTRAHVAAVTRVK